MGECLEVKRLMIIVEIKQNIKIIILEKKNTKRIRKVMKLSDDEVRKIKRFICLESAV